MQKRIFKVREHYHLSQDDFAKKLGVTKSAISGYETGRRNPTEQIIKAICREFFIEEAWLRTGEGEMIQHKSSDILEQVIMNYNCNTFEAAFIRSYFNLNPDERINLSNYLFKIFGIALNSTYSVPESFVNTEEETTAAAEAAYRKSLHSAKNTVSIVSSTIEDTGTNG